MTDDEKKQKNENWQVIIQSKDGDVKFIYDGNVNRYTLIGLYEVELELLKKELTETICNGKE